MLLEAGPLPAPRPGSNAAGSSPLLHRQVRILHESPDTEKNSVCARITGDGYSVICGIRYRAIVDRDTTEQRFRECASHRRGNPHGAVDRSIVDGCECEHFWWHDLRSVRTDPDCIRRHGRDERDRLRFACVGERCNFEQRHNGRRICFTGVCILRQPVELAALTDFVFDGLRTNVVSVDWWG